MAFQGYTQQTVDFMWGIRFNNERGWFMEHKDDYINTFLTPTKALGEQVYDAVHELLPDEPLMLKVSRIYRDARRLFGRGPYKDHLWWCIRTGDKDWTGRPTFWFELGPDYYSFGLGFWSPAAALMETGIDYRAANKRHFRTKTKKRLALEAELLRTMEFYDEGRVVVVTLPLSLAERLSLTEADMDDVSALGGVVEGTDCSITMKETKDGAWKISVRTGARVNATKACAALGGGGHRAASGCVYRGPLAEAKAAILAAVQAAVEE